MPKAKADAIAVFHVLNVTKLYREVDASIT